MTGFEIQPFDFTRKHVDLAVAAEPRLKNWPVVYLINNSRDVYVGETVKAGSRMVQHLASGQKEHLKSVRVILDQRFNKSVCLDLEAYLIRLLDGDGQFTLLNRNEGISDSDYYDRERYGEIFRDIFEELKTGGFFLREIPAIENQDLFKLSPFKSLNDDQQIAVHEIVTGLGQDVSAGRRGVAVVQGAPGTGKTIVGIFLTKLLRDLDQFDPADEVLGDSVFSDFFLEGNREPFKGLRVGMVVPQQSLRASISRVFKKSPALKDVSVLTAFDVGEDPEEFDVLVVDEAHRLTQYSAQSIGVLTKRYKEITEDLFGFQDQSKSQIDWLLAKSRHVVLLMDTAQTVRPNDVAPEQVAEIVTRADEDHRRYGLKQQMRVKGGDAYINFVGTLLSDAPLEHLPDFGDYDFRLFDDVAEMHEAIREKDRPHGLSRLVAGYAWKWRTRQDKSAYDLEIGDVRLRWNQRATEWITSPSAIDEVGSIHTVQGYDLNYAGVIIGPDLRIDPETGRLSADRNNYFDSLGKRNNKLRGQQTTDDDLLRYIINIYRVLLTRGMRGTYVYVSDPLLASRLKAVASRHRDHIAP